MALTPNSIRISGPSLWRVGTGNNFKGFRLIIPCSLDEEPDGETSVSSDNTAVRSVRLPQLILQPGGQLTGRDAVTTNPNPAAPGEITATSPARPYLGGVLGQGRGLRPFLRPPPRPGRQRPAPSRPRHVTRHAPAARGLHQNKNRGGGTGGGGERADGSARSPPPLVRHDRAPPPGRGREGRGRHPVYRQARVLRRKRSPGSGRVSAHPPAAGACVGGERPRRLRVTPVTTSATHFAPSRQLARCCGPPHPSRGRLLPDTPFRADPGAPEPVPTPPRTSPSSDHPTHTFRPGRAREGVDGSKLSEAYSVPHDEARPRPRHSRSSLAVSSNRHIGGGEILIFLY